MTSQQGVFCVSASQLKLFDLCPRSWFLKHVARAPDDAGAGGLYLTRGNDFDRLVQLHVRDGITGDSGAPKLANRQLCEAKRYLSKPGTAEVQFAYDIDAGGFRVKGKPDVRRPGGWIQDTKTTSDRGPNRGAAVDRPAYALTDAHTPGGNLRPLADDFQARLYAWCELTLDPALTNVHARWIYVSKADCPHGWTAEADFGRADTEAWFDAIVRPMVAEMMHLAAQYDDGEPGGLTARDVGANPDSCRRCFVRAACPGPFEGINIYGITGPRASLEGENMFDLKKLQNRVAATAVAAPQPPVELEAELQASVAAVAINRPPSQRPAALTVSTIEGPAAEHAMLELVHDDGETDAPAPAVEVPPTPKARRGRPRKTTSAPTSGADTAEVTPIQTAGASDADGPLVPTPAAPAASGCAPSVGDLAAAVCALCDAVRSLETGGRCGSDLDSARRLAGGGVS